MVPIFLLLGAFSVAKAFEITSSSPEIITVKKGGDMDLWCKTDSYWEWCTISSVNVSSWTNCEHAWNSNVYNVKGGQIALWCHDILGIYLIIILTSNSSCFHLSSFE